jgi:hypothetical protein
VKRFVSLQFLNLRQSIGLLGRGISPSQGSYLHIDTKSMQTNIHVLSGIRTHDPSVRASEDISYRRPRGHCDRRTNSSVLQIRMPTDLLKILSFCEGNFLVK